jgi:putative ABC transport system permease protein
VSGDFFTTLRIPLLAGRSFRAGDTDVAVINETLAREFWPGAEAVGQQLVLPDFERPLQVVGVVGDQRASGTAPEPQPEMFVPYATGFGGSGLVVVVRTRGEPLQLAAAVREQVAALDAEQPVAELRSLEQALEETMAGPRFYMTMFSLFGAVALALSALGIFGVASYSVTQRTHEVGVRIALGAERRHLLTLIVARGALLTAVGIVIGLAVARALTRYVESLLHGVEATDFATFLTAPLVLAAAALLAFWLPARRAAAVDPVVALRREE